MSQTEDSLIIATPVKIEYSLKGQFFRISCHFCNKSFISESEGKATMAVGGHILGAHEQDHTKDNVIHEVGDFGSEGPS